jgi:hypothetical protein
MFEMHDWTLQSVHYEWELSEATLMFLTHISSQRLVARDVRDLHVPRREEWGPSSSVNKVEESAEAGVRTLMVEMQSGDQITISAAEFELVAA